MSRRLHSTPGKAGFHRSLPGGLWRREDILAASGDVHQILSSLFRRYHAPRGHQLGATLEKINVLRRVGIEIGTRVQEMRSSSATGASWNTLARGSTRRPFRDSAVMISPVNT